MPGSPPTKRRLAALALASVVVTGTTILLGHQLGLDAPADVTTTSTRPVEEPTQLADVDTSTFTLNRDAFCDRVSTEAISRALGQAATEMTTWAPGEPLPESQQVGNEFGCAWSVGPVGARAWVFAPPITPSRAGDFTDEAIGQGCSRVSRAPALGSPSLTQQCSTEAGPGTTSVYGLVGDAWVGCEVSRANKTSNKTGQVERVGEWCVAALEALRVT